LLGGNQMLASDVGGGNQMLAGHEVCCGSGMQ